MTSQGFGAGGFPPGGFGGVGGSEEVAALARQYWSQWGEMLRAGGQPNPAAGFGSGGFPGMGGSFPGMGGGFPGVGGGFPGGNAPAAAGLPGWNEAVAWWSQLAGGGPPQVDATVQRFNDQAQGWYAQIQQLAARFAGQEASAGDVAKAWKDMFAGHGGNPFGDALKGMQGQGQQGFEQWLQQVAPWLEKLRPDSSGWQGTPSFGFTREHEQRWKDLAGVYQTYQRHSDGYQSLMNEALQDAFKRFETKLGACSQPGDQLESMRALFDLWIDSAEEGYAEIASSPRFRDAYGALVNAQMHLRSSVQKQIEQAGDSMGVPSRTEVDAAHRKIAQLERELRRLRVQVEEAATADVAARDARPATAKAAATAAVDSGAPAKKPVAQPSAAAKAPAQKRDVAAAKATGKTGPMAAVKKVAAPAVTKPASAGKATAKTAKKAVKKVALPASKARVSKSTTKGR